MNKILLLCPGCGFVTVNPKENFCPNCGKKLINKCPRCEASIDHPLARFCPVCGMRYLEHHGCEHKVGDDRVVS